MEKLLRLIETNPRLTNAELAVMLGVTEDVIEKQIKEFEDRGIIKGYRAIIDKEKLYTHACTAMIKIRVQPKSSNGFDEIAQKIAMLDEVASIYLMSGGYDICAIVENKSFDEVSMFVVKKLSPLEEVISTSTNFILKKYKETGVIFEEPVIDDRGTYSLW